MTTDLVPAERSAQLETTVELLLVVAFADGSLDRRERDVVWRFLESSLATAELAATGMALPGGHPALAAWRGRMTASVQRLEATVAALAAEVPGFDALPRLVERGLALFDALPGPEQGAALELALAVVHADGVLTDEERQLQAALTRAHASRRRASPAGPDPVPPPAPAPPPPPPPTPTRRAPTAPTVVEPAQWRPLQSVAHPLLDPLEQTFSPHPVERQAQVARDYQLVQHVLAGWAHRRTLGAGRLDGLATADDVPVGAQFLAGHVHVLRPDHPVELIVLGDLHGCYGCLKAALLQSDFINRAWLHQWDPANHPDVRLVLLGDYIDRGRFGFDGVLRAALQLQATLPDHVFLLRGNHEHLVWLGDRFASGVAPAESLASIVPHVPLEMIEGYRQLFEHMPTSLLFDRTLLVHAGIPRDDTIAARVHDLSGLDHPEVRFQMTWSDPTPTDRVPVELQRKTARFGFGRTQFRDFLRKLGCHTLIRGHEQVDAGFETIWDLGEHRLLSVFSAGGEDNVDLPEDSSYRDVTPMALTIQHAAGAGPDRAIPWPLDYRPFCFPPHNGLLRPQPLLEFRYG